MTDEINDAFAGTLDRQPSLQTVNWLLNLRRFDQLDLNPPYQRKSVWSLREKQRFLDTILRNYPSPAIFLHQTFDEDGNPTYHVVDGKQRLSTILAFADGKLRLARDFGDTRLDNANWKILEQYPAIKKSFWTYQLTVEMIDDIHEPLVREIFSRLNRNSTKLEPQEIRHAKYDGWLVTFLETQAEDELWRRLRVSTTARERRMADVQLLSEFAQVLLEDQTAGFDQDSLDAMYALYEDPEDSFPEFDAEAFETRFRDTAEFLSEMDQANGCIRAVSGSKNHLYSIWALLGLARPDKTAAEVANAYSDFIAQTERIKELDKADPARDRSGDDEDALTYQQNSIGAATESPQRRARHEALTRYFAKMG